MNEKGENTELMKKRMSLLLTGVLCFSFICTPVFAEDKSAEIQDAINQINTAQTTMENLEKEMKAADEAIANLDTQMNDLNAQQAVTQQELDAAQAECDALQAEVNERIRVMYMYGNDGYAQMLFSATSISDFIARADMMKNLMQADKDAVTKLEDAKKTVEDKNNELVAMQQQTAQAKTDQENLKNQKNELIENNKSLIEEKKAMIQQELADGATISDEVKKNLANVAPFISTGDYAWPLPTNATNAFAISSVFGGRIHPITGELSDHEGVDIAAPGGTPILAAADGVVTIASYYGGYGNCVVIDMGTDAAGQRLSTLYGHMSQIGTSVGATVKKGDVIGYVGSTGNSTGNHLHFGWMINGNFTDPLEYYKDLESNFFYVD